MFPLENFVNKAMLDVDTSRICALEISNQLLKWGRILKRVDCQNVQEFLCLGLEASRRQLLRILERRLSEDNFPHHQLSFLALFESGSAIPFLIDSRIPGTASKKRVS